MDKPYFVIPIEENDEPLVDLGSYGFELGFNYYTSGFTTYKNALARKTVADKLVNAKNNLPTGYNFKIYDPWRSVETQQNMVDGFARKIRILHPEWNEDQVMTETYEFAAPVTGDPKRPPNHNTGGATDLTILDENRTELDMGGEFDETTERSFLSYYADKDDEVSRKIQANRMMLQKVMTDEGFAINKNEWWHFDYGNQRWAYLTGKEKAFYGGVDALELPKTE